MYFPLLCLVLCGHVSALVLILHPDAARKKGRPPCETARAAPLALPNLYRPVRMLPERAVRYSAASINGSP
jgi:hypothetical protein